MKENESSWWDDQNWSSWYPQGTDHDDDSWWLALWDDETFWATVSGMDSEWWGDWGHDEDWSQDFTPETTESPQTFRQHLVEKGLDRKQRYDEWSQQAWWFADQALPEKVDEQLAGAEPAEVVEPGSLPGDDILLGTIKFSKNWTKQLATLTDGYDWSDCYAIGGGFILDFVGPAVLKYEPSINQFPLNIHILTHGERKEGHGGDGNEVPGDIVKYQTPQERVEVPSKFGPLEDH